MRRQSSWLVALRMTASPLCLCSSRTRQQRQARAVADRIDRDLKADRCTADVTRNGETIRVYRPKRARQLNNRAGPCSRSPGSASSVANRDCRVRHARRIPSAGHDSIAIIKLYPNGVRAESQTRIRCGTQAVVHGTFVRSSGEDYRVRCQSRPGKKVKF